MLDFLYPPKTTAEGITIREVISKIEKIEMLNLTRGAIL